jgi:SNF2 family DNA or RNA helicase
MTFLFKTQPYRHQLAALERSADAEAFALLMSMRTGKSKTIIDNSTYLYGRGRINCAVVIAPNGVHRNWVTDEIPLHCPDEVQPVAAFWSSTMNKAQRQQWEALFDSRHEGLRYATMTYDAVITPKGKAELKRLLTTFNCMLSLDEAHRIKNVNAKRTKTIQGAAKYAPFRRILSGTIITNSGALDLYSPFKFLDPYILGHSTFTSFRAQYAETEVVVTQSGRIKLARWANRLGIQPPSQPTAEDCRAAGLRMKNRDYFETVVGYRGMDALRQKIAPHAIVVRREDCEDMPDMVRQRIEVELTPEQKRIYKELLEESVAELQPPPDLAGLSFDEQIAALVYGGDKVKAQNALSKLLRLQQVLGGHVPDQEGRVHEIASNRLKTLLDWLEDIDGKVIIWSRFRPELAAIEQTLADKYGRDAVVAYHGGVADDARELAKQRFQKDDSCRYFVGNPKSGGVGLPLFAADTMIYYSTEYSAEVRWQSEERATKAGKHKILLLDMVAPNTVDEKVLAALKNNRTVSDEFYAGLV